MREYWNMHDTLQTKISTLEATNKEQADRIKELVEALEVTVPLCEHNTNQDVEVYKALLQKAKEVAE